jgi:hypothetical protein
MVKLQVFGNNSKTVSNIKNLTWGNEKRAITPRWVIKFTSKLQGR